MVDVHSPTTCNLHLAETNETITDVSQAQLETVVPRSEGSRVLVVRGVSRGERARLLSRNATAGAAAVQLTGDLTVHKVGFDDISEYVGEYGDEE